MHHPHKALQQLFLCINSPSLACNLVDCVTLFLERTHSGVRICFLEQMGIKGRMSYMAWIAQVDSKAVFPTAMAHSHIIHLSGVQRTCLHCSTREDYLLT